MEELDSFFPLYKDLIDRYPYLFNDIEPGIAIDFINELIYSEESKPIVTNKDRIFMEEYIEELDTVKFLIDKFLCRDIPIETYCSFIRNNNKFI